MSQAMRRLAVVNRSGPRGLYPATATFALALALVVCAALPARAQSPYSNYNRPDVLVDLSALDQLGPAPTVPDGRFVLHPPRAMAADQSGIQQKIVLRPPADERVADNSVEHFGSVTVDYSALPPAGSLTASDGPRIALHLPGTQAETVAAAVPPASAGPQGPSDTAVKPPLSNAVVAVPLAPPVAPATPSMPQVAALPPSQSDFSRLLSRLMPSAGPPGAAALEPGAASAATLPATALIAVPKSDSGAVRFAPGAADLGGDARSVLDTVAQQLSAQPSQHIQLVAYASAPGGDANGAVEARLTSLARAVVVRDYLIQRGVSGAQIKVRALGNRAEGGGSLDRVDLMVLGS
jgi:outer membrane protein OmpA-like peptidoglycan-associated protein